MIEHPNHQIKEVICAIEFASDKSLPEYLTPLSTEIKKCDFDFETLQIPTVLNVNITQNKESYARHQEPSQYIYKHKDGNRLIIVGQQSVSFHYRNEYPGYKKFVEEVIETIIECYQKVGLSFDCKKVRWCYINHFELNENETMSDWFKFVMPPNILLEKISNISDDMSLSEIAQTQQFVFKVGNDSEINGSVIMNSQETGSHLMQLIVLSTVNTTGSIWKEPTIRAHDLAYNAFFSMITDKTFDYIKREK